MQAQLLLNGTWTGVDAQTASAQTRGSVAAGVRNLSKSFNGTRVLSDVSFDVAEGESLVLLGASGSGKTTILRIIAGLESPDAGRVVLHGRDVTSLPARERGVGVIFQSYALFQKMTVEQNVGYGLRIRRRARREVKETVERLLSLVRLEEHRTKYPSQLSGGQQQRVAIARTLAYRPQVLLFDEPFGALDAHTRVRLRRELRSLLLKLKVPAVFITHDQEEALELGDRIAVVNAGRIEQVGTPVEVYDRPRTEYVATFLGAANVMPGIARAGKIVSDSVTVCAPEALEGLREGQAVRLIFRPEEIYLSGDGSLPPGIERLAGGRVVEAGFAGSVELLKVRLEPGADASGDTAPARSITGVEEDSESRGTYISVTRSRLEINSLELKAGDRVTVGVARLRVLPTAGSTLKCDT
jgi:sulfate/thiosulfate transport system ATP-binding protein